MELLNWSDRADQIIKDLGPGKAPGHQVYVPVQAAEPDARHHTHIGAPFNNMVFEWNGGKWIYKGIN